MDKKKSYRNTFLKEMGGIDIGYVGGRFTWDNGQEGQAFIKERLDRVIADHQWVLSHHKATLEPLTMEKSDHCSIILNTAEKDNVARRPFRFCEAWASDSSC